MKIKKLFQILKKPLYLGVFGSLSLSAFSFYTLISNSALITELLNEGNYFFVLSLLPSLMQGFISSTSVPNTVLIFFNSIMIGLNIATAIYRFSNMPGNSKSDLTSLSGIMISTVAPACGACATTFIAFAGATSLFALLPYEGLELQILAATLLIISLAYTLKNINPDICSIDV